MTLNRLEEAGVQCVESASVGSAVRVNYTNADWSHGMEQILLNEVLVHVSDMYSQSVFLREINETHLSQCVRT